MLKLATEARALADACAGDWDAVREHLVVDMLRSQADEIERLTKLAQVNQPAGKGPSADPVNLASVGEDTWQLLLLCTMSPVQLAHLRGVHVGLSTGSLTPSQSQFMFGSQLGSKLAELASTLDVLESVFSAPRPAAAVGGDTPAPLSRTKVFDMTTALAEAVAELKALSPAEFQAELSKFKNGDDGSEMPGATTDADDAALINFMETEQLQLRYTVDGAGLRHLELIHTHEGYPAGRVVGRSSGDLREAIEDAVGCLTNFPAAEIHEHWPMP